MRHYLLHVTFHGWVCHYFNLCVLQIPPSQTFPKLPCALGMRNMYQRWKEKNVDRKNKGQNRYVTRLHAGPHNKGTRNPHDLLEWKMFLPLLQLIHHSQEEMCLGKVEDSCKFTNNYNNTEGHTPTQLTHTTHAVTHILFLTQPFSQIQCHTHTISHTLLHTYTHTLQ